MKNYKVMRDTLDQLLIVDMSQVQVNLDEESTLYMDRYFIAGDCSDYVGIHVNETDNQAEAARLIAEWQVVSANQNFVNPAVVEFEICTEETRYRVTRDMPDWIVAYVDYIDPLKDRAPAPVEMQYVNRRISDGALWPTFCPITSEGWEQIGAHPIAGRHEIGDTVLVFDGFAKPEKEMHRGKLDCTAGRCFVGAMSPVQVTSCINFSKGDHLSADEREAWHQEALRFQESYYSTF